MLCYVCTDPIMEPDESQSEFECPVCGGMLLIAASEIEQIAACPLCHEDVTIPAAPEANDADFSPGESERDELDANRIQQRSTLRRALYRSRSYAIIASIVCVVAVAQLAQFAYRAIQAKTLIWAVGYILAMLVGVVGAIFFYRRAIAFHQEARRSESSEPHVPPDFSTLGDGSQQWQNLHDVH
ncbi:hypothetical protein BH09PLA1_BH09PLA1_05930 [soil metagenome]